MIMNFESPLPRINAGEVLAVTAFANGCFSVWISFGGERSLFVYDADGILKYEVLNIKAPRGRVPCGIYLGGNVFALCAWSKKEKKFTSGHVRDTKGYRQYFDGIQVFENNWYCLSVKGENKLFNGERCVASGFGRAKVFDMGFALQEDSSSDVWELFTPDAKPVRTETRVKAFVGDGNMLVEKSITNEITNETTNEIAMKDFSGKELRLIEPVSGYSQMASGRFILEANCGEFFRMYDPSGHPMAETIRNAYFLPDGRFVQYDEWGLMYGIYKPDGIIEKRPTVYKCQPIGEFYLIDDNEADGRLFDNQGNELGQNYKLVATEGGFALLKNKYDKYELFNENGLVLSLS